MMQTRLVALVLLMAFFHPFATLAQTPLPPTQPATTAPIAPAAATPSALDLQALNFYLQQKDQASADAELRRLRAQFPTWVPPADPSKLSITQPATEIDTIYRQIAAGQLAQARTTIAATQAEYSAWVAPADMMRLLETAEGQVRLDAALDAGNADEALQITSKTDGLLRCDRVNNAWRIAKAQEAKQAPDAAVMTYTGIVNSCTNFPDIAATLEKSDTVTSDAVLGALFDTARSRFPDKSDALAALQAKLLAGRGVNPAQTAIQATASGPSGNHDHKGVIVRPRARPVQGSAADTNPVQPSAKSKTAAKDSAIASSDSGQKGSVDPGQCLAATQGAASAQSHYQRAWCAYNRDRPLEALAEFKSAEPSLVGTQRRDARFGIVLSYLKMNMTEEASRLAATTDLTHQQRVEAESSILTQRGVQAYKQRSYSKSIGYFDALEQLTGRLPIDLAMLRGYAYLNSGNKGKAHQIFLDLNNQLATDETRAGVNASK